MAQTSVRPVAEKDFEDWKRLYQGYADFYQVEMNNQILAMVWSWIQDPQQPFYALIAISQDNQALGLMHFRAMPSPLRGAMVGFLDDLFVDPTSRGLGVADALFAELKTQAQIHDWPLMRWITADNNYPARSLYDQLSTRTGWITYQMDLPR